MKIETFLHLMPTRGWTLKRGTGAIRLHANRHTQCPISSIEGESLAHAQTIGAKYGMSKHETSLIIHAVDARARCLANDPTRTGTYERAAYLIARSTIFHHLGLPAARF